MTHTAQRGLRLGMITPSSNTCLEPTTYRLLAGLTGETGATAHFSRLPVRRIAIDAASDAQFTTDAMAQAAELLADAKVDVVVWNGTLGSWLGIDYDRGIAERL
jgi:maleate isomerase